MYNEQIYDLTLKYMMAKYDINEFATMEDFSTKFDELCKAASDTYQLLNSKASNTTGTGRRNPSRQ